MSKEQIEQIIKDNPKHFSQIVKRDRFLHDWVMNNSGNVENVAERIHQALTGESNMCELKHIKKFKSIKDGYGFCGRANVCECARLSVSKSVSKSKSLTSKEEKLKSNKKREKTSLERYGVINNGQTSLAKSRHVEFYKNHENVDNVKERILETLLKRYGVTNARQIPGIHEKIQETLLERYGVQNIAHIRGVREKIQKTKDNRYPNYSSHMLNTWFKKLAGKYAEQKVTILIDKVDYKGIGHEYPFKCNQCDRPFTFTPTGGNPIPLCKQCNPVYGSKEQQQVYDYLKSIGVTNIVSNDRAILNGKELDIYLPDYSLAIEYNGVYWHNDSKVDKNYHYEKYKACEVAGVELISIFSSYWKHNRVIVENMLRNKVHKSADTVYARKCIVQNVLPRDSNDFLRRTHIFGNASSTIKIGLYYNDELLALMLFNKPRFGIGKNQIGYELVRYSSSVRVVGGASKLMSHFVREYSPESIYSFSDNSFSTGNLYTKLGFSICKEYGPSYWYCEPGNEKLHHRFKFRKDNLKKYGFDKDDFTEREIMTFLGFWRVWDTGKKKWILNF